MCEEKWEAKYNYVSNYYSEEIVYCNEEKYIIPSMKAIEKVRNSIVRREYYSLVMCVVKPQSEAEAEAIVMWQWKQ